MDSTLLQLQPSHLNDQQWAPGSIGSLVKPLEPTQLEAWLAGCDLVLLGLPTREDYPADCEAADLMRQFLFALYPPQQHLRLADAGNLPPQEDLMAVYTLVEELAAYLARANKRLLLLGGPQQLTWAQYKALEVLERPLNYVHIDCQMDCRDSQAGLNAGTYNHLIFSQPSLPLEAFTQLGGQGYLFSPEEKQILHVLDFEWQRAGVLNHDPHLAEPSLRVAQLVSMDLAAVRSAEAPATANGWTGGLTLETACRLARYAGAGLDWVSFGLYGLLVGEQGSEASAQTAALVLWHVLEGWTVRQDSRPNAERSNVTAYHVVLDGPEPELRFFHHEPSDQWWMQVRIASRRHEMDRFHLVPCTQADYRFCCEQQDLPQRWNQAYHRYRLD